MTSYTRNVKTAISLPDAEFERNERVARRHGLNRSEFYRLAATRLADSMEDSSALTIMADTVIARTADSVPKESAFLRESERLALDNTEW